MNSAKRGDWVKVYQMVLPAGERAPQVPEDTQKVPLEMWLKGFLAQERGLVGEQVVVKTVTGREVTGKLVEILPDYVHTFGIPQPELITVGTELKKILQGGGRVD